MTKIELTQEEAESFIEWRKHQHAFEILRASRIFDIKAGSAEINFDGEGHIASIKAHLNIYRRGTPVVLVELSPDPIA